MAFIDGVIKQAQGDPKRIVLPETDDERVLRAADKIEELGVASVRLIGPQDAVVAKLQELGITRDFEIIDPAQAQWKDDFVQELCELRKAKGMTPEKAAEQMAQGIPHGVMMLHKGMADGLVAGAAHSTGDTLRPALQILRTAPGIPLVSSVFFMCLGEETYIFSDCALVEDPSAEQLAAVAITTAATAVSFGFEPKVAMLSYSTKGSASSKNIDKVVEATRLAQEQIESAFGPDSSVVIDGELQVDAAIVKRVGSSKAPGSPVAGQARVLIFPDLNAGNIGYKLVQYLGGAQAYGPMIQGMRLPVNDLSRGCSVDDIVGVAALTVVQCQQRQ
jgi:phosphate acetyltransferase